MKESFRDYLKSQKRILHCGATGTELMKMGGVTPGPVNNLLHPDYVLKVQESFVRSGATVCTTNTWSINPVFAAVHCKGYDWREINRVGVELALKVSQGRTYVMGNVGPTGEMLEPYGSLTKEAAYDAFRQQIEILAAGGVDGFSLQTFFQLEEMKLAVKAVHDVCDLPIMAMMVFNTTGATLMGETPEQCYNELMPLGIDTFGHNCGEIDCFTLGDLFAPLAKTAEIPLTACTNGGKPKTDNGKPVYDLSVEDFYAGNRYLLEKGFRIVGGCCGIDEAHIAALRDLID